MTTPAVKRYWVKDNPDEAIEVVLAADHDRVVEDLRRELDEGIREYQRFANQFRDVLNTPDMPAGRLPTIIRERLEDLRGRVERHKKAHTLCEAGDPLDAIEELMESERSLKADRDHLRERVSELDKQGNTAWLVEKMMHSEPAVWLCSVDFSCGSGAIDFGFTNDANKAIRFSRQADAEQMIAALQSELFNKFGDYVLRATEHMWLAAEPRGK